MHARICLHYRLACFSQDATKYGGPLDFTAKISPFGCGLIKTKDPRFEDRRNSDANAYISEISLNALKSDVK